MIYFVQYTRNGHRRDDDEAPISERKTIECFHFSIFRYRKTIETCMRSKCDGKEGSHSKFEIAMNMEIEEKINEVREIRPVRLAALGSMTCVIAMFSHLYLCFMNRKLFCFFFICYIFVFCMVVSHRSMY